MIGKAIHALLTADSDVTDIVGSGDNARIFPVAIAQGEVKPAIVYRTVRKDPFDTKSGVSDTDRDEVEIIAVSEKYGDVDDLSEKIRAAVDGKRGTYGGVPVNETYFIDWEDDFDDNARAYLRIITFQIWINR